MVDVNSVIKNVLTTESEAILKQLGTLDIKTIEHIVDLFCECKGKIFITGCGTSGAAAKKVAHSLCCIDKPAIYLNPADALHGGMGVVSKSDIVVFISKGGATSELVPIAEICKKEQVTTIVASETGDSSLAKLCNIWLKVIVEKEPDEFNMLATASTLSVISVFDAITICVMQETGFSKEDFALIHPGGAVGKQLLNQ